MNNFVVSNPVEDFRARRRVLMTLPFGNTTVYVRFDQRSLRYAEVMVRTTLRNHSPRAVPYLTALAILGQHRIWELVTLTHSLNIPCQSYPRWSIYTPVTLVYTKCVIKHTAPGPGSILQKNQPTWIADQMVGTHRKEQRNALVTQYLVDVFPTGSRLADKITVGLCSGA